MCRYTCSCKRRFSVDVGAKLDADVDVDVGVGVGVGIHNESRLDVVEEIVADAMVIVYADVDVVVVIHGVVAPM